MAMSVFLVLVSTRTATSSTALLAPQGAPTDNVVTRVGYAPTACPQMNCLRDTRAQQRRPLWEELPLRGQLLQLSDGACDNRASSTFYYHYNYTMTGDAAGVLQGSGRGQRQDLLPPARHGAADENYRTRRLHLLITEAPIGAARQPDQCEELHPASAGCGSTVRAAGHLGHLRPRAGTRDAAAPGGDSFLIPLATAALAAGRPGVPLLLMANGATGMATAGATLRQAPGITGTPATR